MRVYVVRHGEAAIIGGGLERELTPAGVEGAQRAGQLLFAEDPQLLLYSPRLRTTQTARQIESMCHGLEIQESEAVLPPSGCYEVAAVLEEAEARGLNKVVLVSHMPLVAELVAWFLTGSTREYHLPGFPEAGVVCLDMDWIGFEQASLAWYAFPPQFEQKPY